MSSDLSVSKPKRNSVFELLRILSMLMILFFHSYRNVSEMPFSQSFYAEILKMWGIVGVDLFVMISAYFLVDQKFKTVRILDIILKTTGYFVMFNIVYLVYYFLRSGSIPRTVLPIIELNARALVDPLWIKQYWFVAAYAAMVLVSPLINALLYKLDATKIKLLLIVFSFVPFVSNFQSATMINDVFNFLYIYMLIGYLKTTDFKVKKLRFGILFILLTAVVIVSKFIMRLNYKSSAYLFIQKFLEKTLGNTGRHSIVVLVFALLIFGIAVNIKPFYSKSINFISRYVFGVYLFHENPLFNICNMVFVKAALLKIIAANSVFYFSYIGVVVAIFISGIIFDIVYIALIHKPTMKFITGKFGEKIAKTDEKLSAFSQK